MYTFCRCTFCLFIPFVVLRFVVKCFVFLYLFSWNVLPFYMFCHCTFCLFIPFVVLRFVIICFVFFYFLLLYVLSLYVLSFFDVLSLYVLSLNRRNYSWKVEVCPVSIGNTIIKEVRNFQQDMQNFCFFCLRLEILIKIFRC